MLRDKELDFSRDELPNWLSITMCSTLKSYTYKPHWTDPVSCIYVFMHIHMYLIITKKMFPFENEWGEDLKRTKGSREGWDKTENRGSSVIIF